MKKRITERLKPIGIWIRDRIRFTIYALAIFVILTFTLNVFIKDIAVAVTPAGTLTLALVALWAIWNSNEQEKRRRQDAQNKENRDKKERILIEVIEWAINVGRYMLSRNLPPFESTFIKQKSENPSKIDEYLDDAIENDVIKEYTKFRLQSVYIAEISRGIPKIECLVNDAIKHLRGELRLLNKFNQRYNNICVKKGEEKADLCIARNEDRLYKSVIEIIKTIGNISSLD